VKNSRREGKGTAATSDKNVGVMIGEKQQIPASLERQEALKSEDGQEGEHRN